MSTPINSPVLQDHVEPYSLPLVEGRVITPHGEVTTGNLPTAEDITTLIEQSKVEGYAAGHQEGVEQGREEVNAQIETLAQIAKQFDSPLDALDDEVLQSIASLAGIVAKSIVKTHLVTQPEEIVAVVRDAVNHLPLSDRKVTVYLNPEDLLTVESALSEQPIAQSWSLHPDAALSSGGCLVRTNISTVDATLEARVEQAVATMKGDEFTDAE